jgi:hypothetical protein
MADQANKGSSTSTPSSTSPKPAGQATQGSTSSMQKPSQPYSGTSQPGSGNSSSNTGQSSAGQSSSGSSSGSSSAQGMADKAASAGRDLKSTATDLANSSADAIKSQAAGLMDAAKSAASQAGERLQKEVDTRKGAGAQYIGNLADTLKRAAREFDADLPIAGTYIRKAAAQVETVSDTIENGNINDLVRSAQSFARRQPTAFLGLAVLAGFGAIRFLKSSASSDDSDGEGSSQNSYSNENRPGARPGMNRYSSTADNRGYRDEFTK